MTTLAPPRPPVQSNPSRKPRRFGAGLLATMPHYLAPYTAADDAWWAEQTRDIPDPDFDHLASVSLASDRLEAGPDA